MIATQPGARGIVALQPEIDHGIEYLHNIGGLRLYASSNPVNMSFKRFFTLAAYVSFASCQSWNATGTRQVSLGLSPDPNVHQNWNVSIGISQRNETADNLVKGIITQQIWTNITSDPACDPDTAYNSVCAISFVGGSLKDEAQYERMQNDPGDCSTGISEACRADLATAALNYLQNDTVADTLHYSRLCNVMPGNLAKNLPASCKENNATAALLQSALGLQLLTPERNSTCNATNMKRDASWSSSDGYLVQISEFDNKTIKDFSEQYDFFVTRVTPMLLVSMPFGDTGFYNSTPDGTRSEMVCLRPYNIAAGSETPQSVPHIGESIASVHQPSVTALAIALALAMMMF